MMSSAAGYRFRLGPTLFTIVAVTVCLGLGVWQIERLHWKEGLIAAREAALAAPPAAPPASLAAARELEFHQIVATGTYLNGKETYLHTVGAKGGLGFDVLTPLRLNDGRVVMVNRGFVPADREKPTTREAGEPSGQVQVHGLLRLPPATKPGMFIPDNQPDKGEWFWLDLPSFAKAGGLQEVAPYYIQADATPNPGGLPKGGGPDPRDLPNNHLQYAITWFSLAAAALVIYVLSQRRNRAER
jgi:surfeit locus 1 family protein